MRLSTSFGLIAAALLLSGCLVSAPPRQQTRVDEIPMYGGLDRAQFPELKSADDKFIADVSQAFGSRERAAQLWVNQGYKFYREDNLGMAMRRFNQAWLLNPGNAEVFAGFAVVLHDQGRNCAAKAMMERALALDPPTFQGIYADAGRIFTLCAVQDGNLEAAARERLLARADELYARAEQVEPNKAYVYESRATACYWRGQYAEAWAMVARARAAGGAPGGRFLALLRAKMAEPARP
ncbi:tetratricopeptide repeat protein [Oryzomicrobium sp.]|uniref:tetratricopeptide repeat protein n=1 Tax=Oryzomicrobium sp. TaxID=1911578 RepID=UPI0025F5ECA9|nr:tetratricopeptide repeat protein [Oryzomicrobium sp.]MCE1243046.1 tetratricopeptide repeat protein [Oryzomicrobium sp.]